MRITEKARQSERIDNLNVCVQRVFTIPRARLLLAVVAVGVRAAAVARVYIAGGGHVEGAVEVVARALAVELAGAEVDVRGAVAVHPRLGLKTVGAGVAGVEGNCTRQRARQREIGGKLFHPLARYTTDTQTLRRAHNFGCFVRATGRTQRGSGKPGTEVHNNCCRLQHAPGTETKLAVAWCLCRNAGVSRRFSSVSVLPADAPSRARSGPLAAWREIRR